MSRRRLAFAAVLSTTIAGVMPLAVSPAHAAPHAAAAGKTADGTGKGGTAASPRSSLHGTTVHSAGTHVVTSGVTAAKAGTKAATPAASTIGTLPTEMYFASPAGDWVAGGQTEDRTDVTVGKSVSSVAMFSSAAAATDPWSLTFAQNNNVPLALGTFNVSGADYFPILSFTSGSHGCGSVYGSYTITELAWDATGAISHFNATFVQHCEQSTRPALVGLIRYNATTPTQVPTVLLPSLTGSEVGGTVVADASATDHSAPITNYHFAWSDGATDDTTNPVVSHAFATPGPQTVSVTATDSFGNTATTSSTIAPDYLSAGFTPDNALSVDAAVTATSTAGVKSYDIDWGDKTAHGTSATMTHTYAHPGTYPIKVTMTDNEGQVVATDPVDVTTQGSDYTATGPTRIMDTRDGTGLGGHTPKLTAAAPISLKVAGVNGVPANATAVAVNVTVVDTDGTGGAVGVTPDGAKLATSNLNYAPGQIVPNMVIVPIAADGSIEFQKLGAGQTDVIADLFGYYTPTAAQGFASTDPYRALDTRNGTGWGGGRIATGRPIRLKVTGVGGVPASGVTAVAVNLTVTETAGGGGVLAAGPAGFTAGKTSWTSNLNYGSGQTIANMAIVPVDANGYIDLVNQGPGSASVIMDINGYYSTGAASAYLPFGPVRVVDTRGDAAARIDPYYVESWPWGQDAQGNADPTVTAFVTNTTVVNTAGGGFLTVFPVADPNNPMPPNASNLNWAPGQIVPNMVFARPSTSTGWVGFFNGSPNGAIDLIVDMFGYYSTY